MSQARSSHRDRLSPLLWIAGPQSGTPCESGHLQRIQVPLRDRCPGRPTLPAASERRRFPLSPNWCLTCGETVMGSEPGSPPNPRIAGWQVLARLPDPSNEAELFLARGDDASETALLKYYPLELNQTPKSIRRSLAWKPERRQSFSITGASNPAPSRSGNISTVQRLATCDPSFGPTAPFCRRLRRS